MTAPRADQLTERPLDELVQTVADQAVVMAREQMELARREMLAKARQAGVGAAYLGGAAGFGALASGTGTAALVLFLARRSGGSAAAVVAGAYAGAGALLAREGIRRLREAGPPVPEETVQNAKQNLGSSKRSARASRAQGSRPKAHGRPQAGAKRRTPRARG